MPLTAQQNAIITWAQDPKQNVVVSAVAGSGKSFTSRECIKVWDKRGMKGLVVSFGKDIATQTNNKLKEIGVYGNIARTMHSLGLEIIRYNNPQATVEKDKCFKVIEYAEQTRLIPRMDKNRYPLSKLLDAGRSMGFSERTPMIEWIGLNYENGFVSDHLVEFVSPMMPLFNHREWEWKIDFTDMVFYPLSKSLQLPPSLASLDYLVLDEIQDWNLFERDLCYLFCGRSSKSRERAQTSMGIMGMDSDDCGSPEMLVPMGYNVGSGSKTVVLALGDPDQTIFGFKGAKLEYFQAITQDLDADEMPLTYTFRCPQIVTSFAQQYVPRIECPTGAPQGKISLMMKDDFLKDVQPGDLVYTRFVRTIVQYGIELLLMGRSAVMPGRKIGAALKRAAAEFNNVPWYQLSATIGARMQQLEKQMETRPLDRKERTRYEMFDILIGVIETDLVHSVEELIQLTERLCAKDYTDRDIVLRTVHQIKGMESGRAFYINSGYPQMPKKRVDEKEEFRIQYVAVTRALNELVFVCESPSPELHDWLVKKNLLPSTIAVAENGGW